MYSKMEMVVLKSSHMFCGRYPLPVERLCQPPPTDVRMAWKECEQLNSAISKNNEIKRKISRRLRNNSRQAEKLKSGLDGKVIDYYTLAAD